MRPRWRSSTLVLCVFSLTAAPLWADGHGPAFGYSTATLGLNDTSIETALMWRSGALMFGPRVSYGLKENLQISFSAPFHLDHGDHPTGRFTAMMPGNPAAEVLLGWRLYHASTGIGTRNEATLYLGGSALTQPHADGPPLQSQPGVYGALAVGRVARNYDVWAGAGYQGYGEWNTHINDHQSNSFLTSFVAGWRPSFLNKDYPRPDVRFFWETTGERVGYAYRDLTSSGGPGGGGGGHGHGVPPPNIPPLNVTGLQFLPNSGGTAAFSGPTFLCTYRSVAFQGGVLFALLSQPNGTRPPEKVRVAVGVTYYFFGRRK